MNAQNRNMKRTSSSTSIHEIISSHDIYNIDNFTDITEQRIILYPETEFSFSLILRKQVTPEKFKTAILTHWKEEFPTFRNWSALKISRFLEYKNGEYQELVFEPLRVLSNEEIPMPLFIELSSGDVHADAVLSLETSIRRLHSRFVIKIPRIHLSGIEGIKQGLLKTIFCIWYNSLKEAGEIIQVHYLIRHYDISLIHKADQGGNKGNNHENHCINGDVPMEFSGKFNHIFSNFSLHIYIKLDWIEQIVFQHLRERYPDEARDKKSFLSNESYIHLAVSPCHSSEYHLMKGIIRRNIFLISKDNKVYWYYSKTSDTDQDTKWENKLHHISDQEQEEYITKKWDLLNWIVWKKFPKKILNNGVTNHLSTHSSFTSMKDFDAICKSKNSLAKANFVAKALYKEYNQKDNWYYKGHVIDVEESEDNPMFREITKALILNIINVNSGLKLRKFSLDREMMVQFKNVKGELVFKERYTDAFRHGWKWRFWKVARLLIVVLGVGVWGYYWSRG